MSEMRETWERAAEKNPMFAVLTGRKDWDEDEFMENGRSRVQDVLGCSARSSPTGECLRLAAASVGRPRPSASTSGRVDGVDLAEGMLARAREGDLPANVHLTRTSGEDLSPFPERAFDFVFSELVFQHIEEEHSIASYFYEMRRVMKPGSAALLVFDTRPTSLAAKLTHALPDALLPMERRRHIRRYRRRRRRLRTLMRAARLSVEEERGERTAAHEFLLESKPPAAKPSA